jgi:acetylornithine deacetylase/succinyl-diaminopimelate desuccinylase-like protein
MKGALAAMILAAGVIQRLRISLRGNVLITGVVDEEVSEGGTKHYMATRQLGDFALVGEPTELRLCTAQRGQLMYELTTVGVAAHSSLPREGMNAISKMVRVIKAIEDYSTTLAKRKHRLLGTPTTNVGTITGGTGTSIVPSSCSITIDRRTLPGETAELVDAEFREILEGLRCADEKLQVSLKRFFGASPTETNEDELIVKAVRQSCKDVLAFDPGIHGFPATCDAGDLSSRMPTVVFGPGSLSQAHRPDEYVSIKQVMDAAMVYAGTAITLLE